MYNRLHRSLNGAHRSMARFLVALFATTLIAVQAGAQLGHAAPATSEVFWRTVLPGSPLPDAILRLFRPADTSVVVNKAEVRLPFDYHDYKRRPSDDGLGPLSYESYRKDSSKRAGDTPFKLPGGTAAGTEKRRGTVVGEPPFLYAYKAPSKRHGGEEHRGAVVGEPPFLYAYKQAPSTSHAAGSGASGGEESRARGGGGAAATTMTVFFHEEAVRVGERLPFLFPPSTASALGFLPRRVAESIPFTMRALPGVLAMIGVAPGSATAASMEATLRTCELPALAGEAKFCATSLEALVERAMAVLGTRDVRPLTSTLPRAGAPLQTYTVRAVRPVEGGPSFVACHDEAYPYTVYRCHTTGPARAYMVEMEGGAGAGAVTVATVCHTDTSLWNPEHVSFRLLGTKPGGAPVCHLMPYGHIIWAKNVKRSPA